MYKNLLVTGAAGFIGSNFVNYIHKRYPETKITNIDRVDYCSREDNVHDQDPEWYTFVKVNINDSQTVMNVLYEREIDCVVHFAAQSHVDNSFGNSLSFTRDNVLGTHTLIECCRVYHASTQKLQRFIHISTDEVYGEVDDDHEGCHERSLLNPTNPYAATKAAAEFIVRSYHHSFKMPTVIIRSNNVYGPNQYPEKVVPRFCQQLLNKEKLTIHGNGSSKRNFVHSEDVCRAIEVIMMHAEVNEIYNIGGQDEFTVLEVARKLFDKLNIEGRLEDHLQFVEDRLYNDKRYCVDCKKLTQLGWEPKVRFDDGLDSVIEYVKKL